MSQYLFLSHSRMTASRRIWLRILKVPKYIRHAVRKAIVRL